MKLSRYALSLAIVPFLHPAQAQNSPAIALVANAEGENPTIAPNTWVEVKGQNLSKAGDARTWQGSDFINGKLPTALDGVSVTVNGKSAYVYYISPTQIDILTPPDAMNRRRALYRPGAKPLAVLFCDQRRPLRCGPARRR
jgi:hypothetical protein